jgi:hypothetical protein
MDGAWDELPTPSGTIGRLLGKWRTKQSESGPETARPNGRGIRKCADFGAKFTARWFDASFPETYNPASSWCGLRLRLFLPVPSGAQPEEKRQ